MFIVDANVLLYAVNDSMPRHSRAKAWIEQALSGTESIGFTWVVLLAFVRLATRPGIFPAPLGITDPLDLVDAWLAARPAVVVEPTGRHVSVLRGFLEEAGAAGNLVTDAHLATLSVEHGATVCTFDTDFNRFRGVKVFAPK